MKKKQPTWLDKKIADIESWGALTLFQYLKDQFDSKMAAERNTIFKYGTDTYTGSNLETHDRFVAAINSSFNREFKKIYGQVKEKNEFPERKDA